MNKITLEPSNYKLTGNLLFITAAAMIIMAGCNPYPDIELQDNYGIQNKNTMTVYVPSFGNEELEDTYARVMCLDLQSRGYKVINANKELEANRDHIVFTDPRQTADSLIKKSYLPVSDIIVIVKTKMDTIPFITEISEQATVYTNIVTAKGYTGKVLSSEVAFYDKSINDPIMSFSASDTSIFLIENGLTYTEYPWMIAARQLENKLRRIEPCRNDNSAEPTNIYKIDLWVDKSYRDAFSTTYKDRLQRRFTYVNDILRNQLGIELVISEIKEWDSQFNTSLERTLERLNAAPNKNRNTFRIGITLNKNLKRNWTNKSNLGLAYPFTTDAIITAEPSFPGLGEWNSIKEAITLAHEIGHLFGAIHVTDIKSIMYPLSGSLEYEFDDLNKKIVERTKYNFMKNDKEFHLKNYANDLTEIIKTYPKNTVPVLHAIAAVFMNLYIDNSFQLQTSENLSEFITKIIPDSVYAFSVAGLIEYKLNKLNEARKFFTRAVEMNPEFAEAQWYFADILKKLGEDIEAELHREIAKPYVKYWVLDD